MQSAPDSTTQSASQQAQTAAASSVTTVIRLDHPPRAPLVLRVGVVGHRPDPKKRPDPDVRALRDLCHQLLLNIKDEFNGIATAHGDLFCEQPAEDQDEHRGLRFISSLAEGADQWVALEAEKLGYQLQAVLPFERAEYEKDFFTHPDVLKEHRRLRDRAAPVFELDGCRAKSGESYLAAGRVLLNQTDLLIALWDGKDAYGSGGTGQIVREALARGIPTLCVDWEAPANWHLKRPAWRLLQQPVDIHGDFRLLKEQVRELLLPPDANHEDNASVKTNCGEAYFQERRRSWTFLGGWWRFFTGMLCLQPGLLKIRVPDFVPATRSDWMRDWDGVPGVEERQHKLPRSITAWIEESYLVHYAWANQLSVYYANLYRSSFAWIYLLGALAVFLALIGTTAHLSRSGELISIAAEVVLICGIIGLTWYGRQQRWHERWIDYRTLAERLRLVRFNCLLGGVWQQVNVPSHLATYGNPAVTWMHWHTRAVERAAGLPHAVVSEEYLHACRELLLKALVAGQADYHKNNYRRLHRVDHRLHWFGSGLFLATLAACVIHLFAVGGQWADAWDRWLIFCAAFLPALGAAMAAIRSQGEFQRVVQRSRAMRAELEQLGEAIADVPSRPNELNSQLLQQAVEQTTRLMYNEVLDWRIVFQDRPLVWPA